MLKLLYVINDLAAGGAEGMLARLIERIDRRQFHPAVISLRPAGSLRPRLEQAGTAVYSLDLRGRPADLGALGRCVQLLRVLRPDCVHSWLYQSDILALAAARLAGFTRLIWSIRNCGAVDCALPSRLLARLCARLSSRPAAIVSNSEAGRAAHQRLGYDTSRVVVIPNGFDLERFGPDPQARRAVRNELELAAEARLVGLCARFHPVKDHRTFFAAARALARWSPDVRFVVWGRGVGWDNAALAAMIPGELASKVRLLGERADVARLLAALDVLASSSRSEGFPNVLGEAMACGVACVTTDAGDARQILGDTGEIVPPADPEALAAGCRRVLEQSPTERRQIAERARRRVAEHFEIGDVVRRYEALYRTVAA